MSREPPPASVRLLDQEKRSGVPQSGAVDSEQRAELELSAAALEGLCRPESLERLARGYWRYLYRISLGLIRVMYEPDSRTVVLVARPLALLRFRAPEYETGPGAGSVTWAIERGLLVAREGRGSGYLRIAVERAGEATAGGGARLAVAVEVRNFYPWIRGNGRFARFGTWLYSQTQARIHRLVTRGFLRSLARLELPPSEAGSLRGEIAAGEVP